MSTRAYVVLALILLVIGAGIVWAEINRGEKRAEQLGDLDHDSSDVAVDTMAELAKYGSAVEDDLIEKLSSERKKERMRAAVLLGENGSPEKAGPALVGQLRDEWPPVRRASVVAIGNVAYLDGADALIDIISDADQEMDTRSLAVQALCLLRMHGLADEKAELAVEPLVSILEARPDVPPKEEEVEEEEEVDEDAVEVVIEDPPPAAEAAPADKETELRRECVLALGAIGTDVALNAVFASADDEIEPAALVRQCACMAIEDLQAIPDQGNAEDAALAQTMAETLLGALDDEDADTRMWACRALTRHPRISEKDVDPRINERLVVMAAELVEEGEAGYWGRLAAKTACSSRGLEVKEPNSTHEGTG